MGCGCGRERGRGRSEGGGVGGGVGLVGGGPLAESMSMIVSCLVAKTMALGGVPMGSMKAKDVEMVVAIMKAIGFTCPLSPAPSPQPPPRSPAPPLPQAAAVTDAAPRHLPPLRQTPTIRTAVAGEGSERRDSPLRDRGFARPARPAGICGRRRLLAPSAARPPSPAPPAGRRPHPERDGQLGHDGQEHVAGGRVGVELRHRRGQRHHADLPPPSNTPHPPTPHRHKHKYTFTHTNLHPISTYTRL